MRKANAWADEVAAHATAHYLQRTVVIVSDQQIIMIKPHNTGCGREIPIFIAHNHNHFSFVHKQQAQQILKQHIGKSPRKFAEYQASVLDCQNCPFVMYSTARSLPLHRRCHRMHADKAVADLVRQLVFPTRHVPGDGIPSKFPASRCSHEPDHERDDDDDEGSKPYGYVRRELTPAPQFCAKDYCQLGIVFGYVGVIAFCGLLGGGCRTHRSGSNVVLGHKFPCLINCRSAESAPDGKDNQTKTTSRLGTTGTSHVPTTKMRYTPFVNGTQNNQQFPWNKNRKRIIGSSIYAGVCSILGLIGSLLGVEAKYLSHMHSEQQLKQMPSMLKRCP